jgi:L-threonylcarbamoyladenylate synthase
VGVIGMEVDDHRVAQLGLPRDGDQYAHDLYRMLREADARGLDRVVAVLPEPAGLGAAVADRLRRASGTAS